jgi:zinc protease
MKSVLTLFLVLFTVEVLAAGEPVILFEHDPTLLVSHITLVVQTGSKDDPRDKVGLTNMMGELMLRGTKKRTRAKFQQELEAMGASLGVYVSHDMVFFSGKVIREKTQDFLKLVEDAFLHPIFSPTEFESLRTELLAEISHIKNANNRLGGLAVRKTLFAGTPIERPIVGSLSTIKAIKREDLLRAYNNHFHQANLVFAVASPLKEDAWKRQLMGIWNALPDGARKKEVPILPQVPSKPTVIVVHKEKTSTGAMMFAQAGITAKEDLRYRLFTGNFSFGGEPLVSRLFRTIRGELGWTYAIGSTYTALGPLSKQPGVFVISSTPAVEFTTKTLFKSLEMWKEYLKSGLDSDEMKLARESLINSYPFEFESAEKRLGQRLQSYLYDIPVLTLDQYDKKISDIDNGDVKKALKERHTGEGWLIAIVADKDIVRTQLAEAQKEIPEKDRITISKVITPDELVQ